MKRVKEHYHIEFYDGRYRGFIDTASKDPLVVWCEKEYGNRHTPPDLHVVLIDDCQMNHNNPHNPPAIKIKRHTPRTETDGQIRCRECGKNYDNWEEANADDSECLGIPNLRLYLGNLPRAST